MNKMFGIALVVLAVAIAVVPAFTDCLSQGKALETTNGKQVPMKCHWTGIAEIGVAVPLALAGVVTVSNRRRYSLMSTGALGIALGAMAIAFPVGLIGVCATPTMLCHTLMRPALVTGGSLAVVGSLGIVLISRREKV